MWTSSPKSKTPKGSEPKAPLGMSTQKRDQTSNGKKDGPSTPTLSEYAGPDKESLDIKVDTEEKPVFEFREKEVEEEEFNETRNENEEVQALGKQLTSVKSSQVAKIGRINSVDDGLQMLQEAELIPKSDIVNAEGELTSEEKTLDVIKCDDDITLHKSIEDEKKKAEEAALKIKLEMEEKQRKQEMEEKQRKLEMEANLRKQEIEKLTVDNSSRGNKMFVYPPTVQPDQDIEVFLNRSLSTLNNEPDVLIMGAYNDWRWKSFAVRLNKTDFHGDWWSCHIHVPKEAYKIDFVFFNGQTVYDNNDRKDYFVPVEGGMDLFSFEDLLLEEKRREQERLAMAQAERERQEEEQKRREAEKAASEADRAQAKVETERKKTLLEQVTKKAARSVDNVWYIEPIEFKGEDLVRLYYNKSSGPLAHASEIWIHAGHNNWKDGLSIAERLVCSDRTDGDWWYANGMCENICVCICFLVFFSLIVCICH